MKHLVILSTKNRETYVLKFLDSLFLNQAEFEVLIVDSTEPKVRFESFDLELKTLYRDKKFTHIFHKGRLPSARNRGLEYISNHEYIHFFDDDVILPNDYFEKVEDFLMINKEVSGGGPLISGYTPLLKFKLSKNLFHSLFIPFYNLIIKSYSGKVTKSCRNYWVPEDFNGNSLYVDWIPGCSMFFKSHIFNNFTFNQNLESLFLGYSLGEDLEFTYRVSREFKLAVVKNLKVVHDHAPSPRADLVFINGCFGALTAHMHTMFPNDFKKRNIFVSRIFFLLKIYYAKKEVTLKEIFILFRNFKFQFDRELLNQNFKQ